MAPIKSARVEKSEAKTLGPKSLVTIEVGVEPNQETFVAHEGIICARSEFFRRAMNGNWTESKEKLVKLRQDDPKAFAVYLNHVYTAQLPTMSGKIDVDPLPDHASSSIQEEYTELAQVYVLSERLQDRKAKNAITLAILAIAQHKQTTKGWWAPCSKSVATIYAGTTEGNLARQLLVDLWTNSETAALSEDYEILPKEFLRDLSVALMEDGTLRSMTARRSDGSKYLEKEVAKNAKSNEGSNSGSDA